MQKAKTPPRRRGGVFKNPAMTYSRAVRTTIGPGCLTAVFGMGTGVASQVWSPEGSLQIADLRLQIFKSAICVLKSAILLISIGSDKSCTLHGAVFKAGSGGIATGLQIRNLKSAI